MIRVITCSGKKKKRKRGLSMDPAEMRRLMPKLPWNKWIPHPTPIAAETIGLEF